MLVAHHNQIYGDPRSHILEQVIERANERGRSQTGAMIFLVGRMQEVIAYAALLIDVLKLRRHELSLQPSAISRESNPRFESHNLLFSLSLARARWEYEVIYGELH